MKFFFSASSSSSLKTLTTLHCGIQEKEIMVHQLHTQIYCALWVFYCGYILLWLSSCWELGHLYTMANALYLGLYFGHSSGVSVSTVCFTSSWAERLPPPPFVIEVLWTCACFKSSFNSLELLPYLRCRSNNCCLLTWNWQICLAGCSCILLVLF